MDNLPCQECTSLNQSCCLNPQILFSMVEIDEIFTHQPKAMEGKILYKGEIPGMVYILNRPPEGVDTIALECCTFYNQIEGKCSIYDLRPTVCKIYGDPKYMECPYKDYTNPGELTELVKTNPDLATSLHTTSNNDIDKFTKDFIDPWIERFMNSDPKYLEFWKKLPNPNFIRNGGTAEEGLLAYMKEKECNAIS